jgi:transposase InsO family protein
MIPDQEIINSAIFNLSKSFPVTRVCRAHKLPRSTYYYRFKRYAINGLKGLNPLSRKPKRSAKRTPKEHISKMIELHKEKPYLKAPRIADELRRRHIISYSDVTVRKYIRQYDSMQPKKKKFKRRKGKNPVRRYGKLECIELDIKGWYWLNKKKVHGLGAIDCYSRLRHIEFLDNMKSSTVKAFLDRLLRKWGKFQRVKTDNGSYFISEEMKEWFRKRCIKHKRIPIGKPWYNGFIESCFKTFDVEFIKHVWFDNIEDAKRKLRQDNRHYNRNRFHRTIGSTPWERFCSAK